MQDLCRSVALWAGKCAVWLSILCVCCPIVEALSPQQRAVFRSAVCSIYVKVTRSAYGPVGSWQGTGFVCDKKRGIVCTNHHVVGRGAVGTYDIEFMDGQKVEARLLYADPWHDFAFLQVDPALIPDAVSELSTFAEPQLGEEIFIAGNNQGQSFSYQKGLVSDPFQPWYFMPEPAFGCVINLVGGSSGSPVVNGKLQVVGVNFAGFGDGRCLEIRGSCIRDALLALQKKQLPKRRHVGVMLALESLEPQLKAFGFSRDVAKAYLKRYPEASFRILQVRGVLKGSPAEGHFEVGDVIDSVGETSVGPDLALFERLLNEAPGQRVRIGFYRKAQHMTVELPLYDLHEVVVNRLVVFGGVTFFEADDYMRWQFDVNPHQVMFFNVLPGSPFSGLLAFESLQFQCLLLGEKNLDALIHNFPTWEKNKTFLLNARFLWPSHSGADETIFSNRMERVFPISYEASQNAPPEFLKRSFQKDWLRVSVNDFLRGEKKRA